ncbi:N-acetyltransferase [Pseudooceanicola sediminis]|uniref:N-acetyltransferase n=1 Tax=Pseudooceanicola sediminis TaxID=2211117 RepID=A0A399J3Q1_9RHOB|nr:GNAT family N-acetyltransferase [Pseudooceanicola sediminis]KAA2313572.1 GNAT family N-acetyltransferase [Puniceibacterium sp. HSS470]RII38582.1 N-acetyltransferase [Pseudooceanicola sediminis]|tara:strand:- start:21727 stop:22281 length:555 start_codon:yes stop_codon:yes gene_type:complete
MIAKSPTHPVLETARLRLVSPAAPGFDAVGAYLMPGARRFVDQHPDEEAAWWSIATIIGHWHLRGYGHFAVIEKETGLNCGLVGPWFPRGWPEPELSWQLLDGAEGKGIATEAARCVLDWLFQDKGWASCVSLVDPENDRSTAMVERLGARPEGMFSHQMTGDLRIWRHVPKTAPGRKLLEGLA